MQPAQQWNYHQVIKLTNRRRIIISSEEHNHGNWATNSNRTQNCLVNLEIGWQWDVPSHVGKRAQSQEIMKRWARRCAIKLTFIKEESPLSLSLGACKWVILEFFMIPMLTSLWCYFQRVWLCIGVIDEHRVSRCKWPEETNLTNCYMHLNTSRQLDNRHFSTSLWLQPQNPQKLSCIQYSEQDHCGQPRACPKLSSPPRSMISSSFPTWASTQLWSTSR